MTIKNKIAAIAVPAMLIAAPALAVASGQIEGGGQVYKVKNVTQNGSYARSANAAACETVQYSIMIHNMGPDTINNVNVKATLPSGVATSHSSSVTISSENANPTSRTETAGLQLSSAQSIAYVAGSTKLYDANAALVSNLPDGIVGSGVNIGNVGVSVNQKRFVNFQAKVNCPTTVTEKTPEQPRVATPTALPETGPEAGLAAAAGTGAMGYAVMAYRRSKQALAEKLINRK